MGAGVTTPGGQCAVSGWRATPWAPALRWSRASCWVVKREEDTA